MKQSQRNRHLRTVEQFLIEGREGGVSLQDALASVVALRSFVERLNTEGRWYKHRIVKRKVVPEVKFVTDPLAIEAERDLTRQAEREKDVWLRSHRPCQWRADSFYTYKRDGLELYVVITLYGPGSIRDEVLASIIREEDQ